MSTQSQGNNMGKLANGQNAPQNNEAGLNVNGQYLTTNEIMSLLRNLPTVFNKLVKPGEQPQPGQPPSQNEAAVALSNMSQQQQQPSPVSQSQLTYPPPTPYMTNQQPPAPEPGPSTHPNGPPIMSIQQMQAQQQQQQQQQSQSPSPIDPVVSLLAAATAASAGMNFGSSTSRKRVDSNGVLLNSEEWAKKRKDNHKEVERRRRGNINEGINDLARIVPNGNGEKAKGAILSRAVQYIHHLKENEARNIEKWTLEKLLMDQAMGDMQGQLEDMKTLWEEEHNARDKAEKEVERLRQMLEERGIPTGLPSPTSQPSSQKRPAEDGQGGEGQDQEGENKRARVQ